MLNKFKSLKWVGFLVLLFCINEFLPLFGNSWDWGLLYVTVRFVLIPIFGFGLCLYLIIRSIRVTISERSFYIVGAIISLLVGIIPLIHPLPIISSSYKKIFVFWSTAESKTTSINSVFFF